MNIFQTKLLCAPSARMVPISLVRSMTEITSVFIMMITATMPITMIATLKTVRMTSAVVAKGPAATSQLPA